MKLVCTILLLATFLKNPVFAQTGNIAITFTPTSGKPIQFSIAEPLFKFNNAHGYWFVNPHTGDRHFNLEPDHYYGTKDVAFITFNGQQNDADVFDISSDSNAISFQGNNKYIISAPEYNPQSSNNKPLHIHITTFTNSEIAFTISGTAVYSSQGSGAKLGKGTISGTGHLYREANYEKSDILPGCSCDPTIYAAVFDADNNLRTTSACENSLYNKLFDVVQNSFEPLLSNVKNTETESSISSDKIILTMLANHVNIDVPAKDRTYCSTDYRHNRITSINAHKTFFENDDSYGIRITKLPSDDYFEEQKKSNESLMKNMARMNDSLMKLVVAKKINSEQLTKAVNDFASNPTNTKSNDDFKLLDVESNLTVELIFNPNNLGQTSLKVDEKATSSVLHNIKGAAFEIFTTQVKDADGDWIPNKMNIYFGKYTTPILAKSNTQTTKALYPINGNKLTIYNIVIKLEGGKALMDKAIANIDFNNLISIISKQ